MAVALPFFTLGFYFGTLNKSDTRFEYQLGL